MKKGGIGGGNTKTGLHFEGRASILDLLKSKKGYTINEDVVYYKGDQVAICLGKNKLYKWLEKEGVDYKDILSKKLLPDEALYVIVNNTLYVVEMKFQEVAGSVDEKLQTCDFKRKQYARLMAPLNIEVEYIYILSDWFRKPQYKDTLDYVISAGCQYYFEYLPLQKLGLPVPE
ncbi:MAG: hypothetical protein WEC84_01775 [Candidatus Andersenbacteria bacterium]